MKIFGFQIKRLEDEKDNQPISFAEPQNDDGAITVTGNVLGGFYNTILDMEGSAKSESELITKYRAMAMQPEIAQAIDDIVNEGEFLLMRSVAVKLKVPFYSIPDETKIKENKKHFFGAINIKENVLNNFSENYKNISDFKTLELLRLK